MKINKKKILSLLDLFFAGGLPQSNLLEKIDEFRKEEPGGIYIKDLSNNEVKAGIKNAIDAEYLTPEKISKDEYFLFLTEKGGIFWEKSRKPNWNNFVNTGTYFDSKFCYLEIDSFQPRLIFQYFNQHLMESAYNSIYDIQFLAKNERIV